MEWCVPLQKLEISKIRIGQLASKINREKKPMAPLAYVDDQMVMPVLSILLPHMTVESYNASNGKLELIIDSPIVTSKLNLIQSNLLNVLATCQKTWFTGKSFSNDEIFKSFQPMIEGNRLHLYCPVNTQSDKRRTNSGVPVWSKESQWTFGIQPGHFVPGQRIRVALQIQGISLQLGQNDNNWTGRSRLQHKIIAVFIKSSESQTHPLPPN